jgi:translocation and assembly module TamB
VSGTNLPLARQAGLIVRSDLDLHLLRGEGELPVIQGQIDLQRSFVLSDLDAVLGSAVRQASRPPPYFSVTQEPMASWRLNLSLKADQSIHVKSPFYRGIHSVNARLSGTLRDPLLTGDVQVNEGRALFPYTSIPIQQGILTFTEQNPEEPRLVVLGASRTFGYDLRMDVSGSLNQPSIQFSSVPSLTSEEIVMMITAGELPRSELTTTTQDRVAKLASLIGKDILNKLGSQDAGEERLILRTGEGISTGGRVTYYLEYRLTDSWGLVGEYDEYDAINAGVKWRIIQR